MCVNLEAQAVNLTRVASITHVIQHVFIILVTLQGGRHVLYIKTKGDTTTLPFGDCQNSVSNMVISMRYMYEWSKGVNV